MQNTAREYLAAVPTLLIVDEAQFIQRSALLHLRWLWGQNFPRFAIVLAGSDLFDLLDIEPSVKGRIDGGRIALRHIAAFEVETLELRVVCRRRPRCRAVMSVAGAIVCNVDAADQETAIIRLRELIDEAESSRGSCITGTTRS